MLTLAKNLGFISALGLAGAAVGGAVAAFLHGLVIGMRQPTRPAEQRSIAVEFGPYRLAFTAAEARRILAAVEERDGSVDVRLRSKGDESWTLLSDVQGSFFIEYLEAALEKAPTPA